MDYGTKYNEVMDHIKTDEAMRDRVLANVKAGVKREALQGQTKASAQKKHVVVYLKRYGALAAMFVLILTMSLLAANGGLRKPTATPESSIPEDIDLGVNGREYEEFLSPGSKDLDRIGSDIEYPEPTDYLEKYLYGLTRTSKDGKIPAFRTADRTAVVAELKDGEKVVVLAERDGSSCVVILESNKAFWVSSEDIVYEGNETEP